MDIGQNFQRIDIVCDQYFQDSVKEQTRCLRGVGTKFEFDDDTSMPGNFRDDFLHNSQNKNALNEFLARKIMSLHNGSKNLIVGYKHSVLSNVEEGQLSQAITYCTSEEADQRLVRHAIDALRDGYKTAVVRTNDTDVLILLISYIFDTNIFPDWKVVAAMGKAEESLTCFDIKNIAAGQGHAKSTSFFYAFSGCDTVSSIFNKGKCKIWDVWRADERFKDITSVFVELGNLPEVVHDYQINTLEYFVKKLYSPAAPKLSESLAKERLIRFECSPDNDLRKLPMSRPGLIQHVKRSCYQAGYLWRECNENIDLPHPTLWGWCRGATKL